MPLLGCIADDFTGATDLSNMLVRGGMRVVQWIGVPTAAELPYDADAMVIALKSRSIPAAEAVEAALAALRSLRAAGARRFLFKYCSTFDSTDHGNIGPVAEALLEELGAEQTIFCPALPEAGRTVYLGHLFVHGRLLNESGMERHPLNPMTDANLIRVLARQSRRRVGLLSYEVVSKGPNAIAAALNNLRADDVALVIVDALNDQHLRDIADAIAGMPLVTGGSGVALGLSDAYRRRGELRSEPFIPAAPHVSGLSAILAGSCSEATQRQVATFTRQRPALAINSGRLLTDNAEVLIRETLDWAKQHLTEAPVLIYSTAPAEQVAILQQLYGRDCVASAIERALAAIARGLIDLGVRRLIVAGGETSGAVVNALGVRALRIGPQIDPGVPWTETLGELRLALALKSGNFGSDDFFTKALEMLP